jgi:hypothetical protein
MSFAYPIIPYQGRGFFFPFELTLFILNLTGFQLHTILELGDGDFREVRKYAGRRDMFFYEMQAALRYVLHETWRDFMVFITADEDME